MKTLSASRFALSAVTRRSILKLACGLGVFLIPGTAHAWMQDPAGEVITAPRSFDDKVQNGNRTSVGFAVGATEVYSKDSLLQERSIDEKPFTMLNSRLFAAVKGRYSQLLLNYNFGFRTAYRSNGFSTSSHGLTAGFTRRMSPRTSVYVTNTFYSVMSDQGLLPETVTIPTAETSYTQYLELPLQRVTQNSITAGVSYQASAALRLGAFLGNDVRRYGEQKEIGSEGFQGGLQAAYQVNQWLSLDSSYSTYFNDQPQTNAANIQRLRVGNFSFGFGPRRTYEISIGGGIERASVRQQRSTGAAGQVSFSKSSENSSLTLSYHKGYSLAVGVGSVVNGHNASIDYNQWLTRRVNFRLGSLYTRGNSLEGFAQDYLTGGAELGIAIHDHVLLTGSYRRNRQRFADAGLGSRADRNTVSFGIQYYLPSLINR